jgi:hypothetical protein
MRRIPRLEDPVALPTASIAKITAPGGAASPHAAAPPAFQSYFFVISCLRVITWSMIPYSFASSADMK